MLEGETGKDGLFRILSLDGGGAKGFYTLGVLREIEGMIGRPLHERSDLIFGTSTGSIIAALIALGHRVEEICALYQKHVPTIMQAKSPRQKSHALDKLAKEVFGTKKFDAVKTRVGIVAARSFAESRTARSARSDPIYPRAQSKADHPNLFRSKSPTSGRHRDSASFSSSGAHIVASVRHADCQQCFVVYHFEFRDSSLSVLFIRRKTCPRTVFNQPPLCHLVAKAMETDGRDEDSYAAV